MPVHSTKQRPNPYSGVSPSGPRPASKGKRRSNWKTEANFGKNGGHYAVGQTTLEYEFTPTQYMQIILGPTISYYNIRGVPGLDDRNMAPSTASRPNFAPS